jgi:O-antigen/teichoic acid export membrane protein
VKVKLLQLVTGQWLSILAGGLLGIYVARVLGPADKGFLALITGSVAMLSGVLSLGAAHASAYFMRDRPSDVARVLTFSEVVILIGGVACALVLMFGAAAFSQVFLDGRSIGFDLIVLLVGSFVVGNAAGVMSGCLIARGETRKHVLYGNAGIAVTIVLTPVGLAALPAWKLQVVLAAALVGQLTSVVLFRAWLRSQPRPDQGPMPLRLGEFLGYGWRAQIGSVASLVFKRVDLFVVGYFLGPAAVGLYSVGLAFRDIALALPRAAAGLVGGELADNHRRQGRAEGRLLRKSLTIALVFSLVAVVGALAVFPRLVPLAFGPDYQAAAGPAAYVMISLVPLSAAIVLGAAVYARGKPLQMSIGNVVSATVGCSIIWYATADFGVVGAAIANIGTSAVGLIVTSVVFFLSRRRTSEHK